MKKTFFLSIVTIALMAMLSSCAVNLGGVTANYSPLNNYYVRNDFANGTHKLVIHNQEDFRRVFGDAAVMGTNGNPTQVNFSRQFVVALILPETNRQTQLEPVMLNRVGDRLYFSYIIYEGHNTSYNIRPFVAMVVDRNEPGDVVFQRVTQRDLDDAGIRYNSNRINPGTNYGTGGLRPSVGH
jgi:hypothetical protein